jgi:putative FmdB family regulatory protein
LYEYGCTQCGEQFEKLVRMADADAPLVCPKCGSLETRRKVSAFGFIGAGASRLAGGGSDCAPSFSGG